MTVFLSRWLNQKQNYFAIMTRLLNFYSLDNLLRYLTEFTLSKAFSRKLEQIRLESWASLLFGGVFYVDICGVVEEKS